MKDNLLAAHIQKQLEEQADIHVTVAQDHDVIMLSGRVGSEEERRIAEQIAASLAPDHPIENLLDVESFLPTGSVGNETFTLDEIEGDEIPEGAEEFQQQGREFELGVDNQPLETNTINVIDDDLEDEDMPGEPEPAYFAPTDPVITVNARGNIEVLGGFAATSDDDLRVQHSAEDGRPGDEALADAIRRELREDALTTDLPMDVEVSAGVAHLRGQVTDLADAENAEEVANRIPGVDEVVDELEISLP